MFEWNTSLTFSYQRTPSYLAWPAHYFFLFLKWILILTDILSPKVWTWEDLLMPRLLPTNTISQPRPLLRLPLPPPSPYSGFYDLSGKQGPCSSPCLGKIIGMTFLCRNVPGFCQQIFALLFLVSTNSFFHEKSLFSNINPPLLYPYLCNPSIEPWTA